MTVLNPCYHEALYNMLITFITLLIAKFTGLFKKRKKTGDPESGERDLHDR